MKLWNGRQKDCASSKKHSPDLNTPDLCPSQKFPFSYNDYSFKISITVLGQEVHWQNELCCGRSPDRATFHEAHWQNELFVELKK